MAKQREAGIDVVSDGEMSKTGFSNYINDRFSGFEGRAEFQADDVADYPNLAMRLFNTPAMAHLVFSNCVGPVRSRTRTRCRPRRRAPQARARRRDPRPAFMGAISPGQIAFNYPDQHYGTHEQYLAALGEALRHEYRTITEAGMNLQIDSPDLAMAGSLPLGGQQRRRLAQAPSARGRRAQRRA